MAAVGFLTFYFCFAHGRLSQGAVPVSTWQVSDRMGQPAGAQKRDSRATCRCRVVNWGASSYFIPYRPPERNPVEYSTSGRTKSIRPPTCSVAAIEQVGMVARNRLRSMQRRPKLIQACWPR
ncbi:MAG: hypothetical protein ACXU7Z_06895 [Burkholderiaceae bacterium]